MSPPPLQPLALCADDYALHPLVDEAVERLCLRGRLSATSCMTTAPRWPEAAARLMELRPRLSAGLHFNLTEGHGAPAPGLGAVIARAYAGRWGVAAARAQWQRQLDAFEQALGTPPDFIDGHQHVHQLPPIRTALLQELDTRYAPHERPWLRSTVPAGDLWRTPKASVIAMLGGWGATRQWRAAGLTMNRGFGGVYGFDAPDAAAYGARMARWLLNLGAGVLVICHPASAPVPGEAIGAQRAVEGAYLESEAFGALLKRLGRRIWHGPLKPLFARTERS